MKHDSLGQLHIYYDSNRPDMVLYDGATYRYVHSLQGDILGLQNGTGSFVVEYRYDAWGRQISKTGSLANSLGALNPFRYRGYVYDTESGLYYLRSRYYNPNWGRFLSADSILGQVGGLLQHNLWAYCLNNPLNLSDTSGNWPKWWETAFKVISAVAVVAAVTATVVAVSAFTAGIGSAAAIYGSTIFLGAALSGINGGVANEIRGSSYTNGYIGGAIGGAIQAACSATPAGTIIGGGVGVAVGTAVTDVMNNCDPDSADSTVQDIASNAITSGSKALVTSSLTAYMGVASDCAIMNGANGLMPTYTRGFGEAVKAFFGWTDDAMVYIWE